MIHFLEPQAKNGKTILFFCRENCDYSQRGIKLMLELGFELRVVYNNRKGEPLEQEIFSTNCDYILCFRSWTILPKHLLSAPKYYAINFHPGPPSYPGSGCINFALYNEEKEFGVTAHVMEEKVDSGKIISYETFPIFENQSLESVLSVTHQKLFNLFTDLLLNISLYGNKYIEKSLVKNESIHWSGVKKTVKQLDQQSKIELDCSEEQLNKQIRAFHHKDFPLYIEFHNKKFCLKI